MIRLRWGLGALLAVVSLVVAAAALRTYLQHGLWLGGLTVVTLAAIDVLGFASLATARRRLQAEIAGLRADPPTGALFAERKRQLTALHAAGVTPDLDALSAATTARELGRAYLGKYLVAVTVLVGLVGTFGGLMETLRSVAPLLADERVTTLKALAGPLAGLDVTFGASLVGILITLALALVQGDLALAEEEALTCLDERTRHVIMPSLWPATDGADERAARELSALRGELQTFIARASEAAGERVARVAATEVDRLVQAVRAALDDSVQSTAARVERGLLGMGAQVEAQWTKALHTQEARLTALGQAAQAATERSAATAAQATGAIVQATEATLTGITLAVEGLGTAQRQILDETGRLLTTVAQASRDSVVALQGSLATLGQTQTAASEKLLAAQAQDAARLLTLQDQAVARGEQALQALVAAQARHLNEQQTAQAARWTQLDSQTQARHQQAEAALQALLTGHVAAAQQAGARQQAALERVEGALLAVTDAHAAEASRITAAHAASAERVEAALLTLARAQAAQDVALREGQQQAVARTEAALQGIVEQQVAGSATLATAHTETAARAERALQALVEGQARQAEILSKQGAQAVERTQAALAGLVEAQAARLTSTTDALCETVRAVLGGEGLRLREAADALGRAAADLATGAQAIGAPLATLGPQLEALSREVALLAARGESEESGATLDELVRLGEGVERLESLVRLAQGLPRSAGNG